MSGVCFGHHDALVEYRLTVLWLAWPQGELSKMMLDCQIPSGSRWDTIGTDEALTDTDRQIRCVECHDAVCAHPQCVNSVTSRFEHISGQPGCSQIPSNFSDVKSKHPDAVT
jgi:hypothetical protein